MTDESTHGVSLRIAVDIQTAKSTLAADLSVSTSQRMRRLQFHEGSELGRVWLVGKQKMVN
jgi:hypothetical protein